MKLNIFRMMAHAEANFIPAMRYANSILHRQKLSHVNRELLILQVAQWEHGAYEWRQHVPIALGVGVTQRQIDCIEQGKYDDAKRSMPRSGRCWRSAGKSSRTYALPTRCLPQCESISASRRSSNSILAIGFYMTMARLTEATDVDLDPAAGMTIYNSGQRRSG